ncbi:MAG: hypothetical protein ACJAVR_001975 [Paracoccaceae bacterium]|jgi:uncharacterized protein YqeY
MRDRIKAALEKAMGADDPTRVGTLRLICAAIRDRDIAARGADDGPDCIPEQELVQILTQMIRQRDESVRSYEEAGRLELAAREGDEIAIIREFLPRPLSEEERSRAISTAIAETKAKSLRDLSLVMGTLKSRYPGRMDFCQAGAEVRSALG